MPQNRRQARQAAIRNGRLNQLNSLGSNPDDFTPEAELNVIEVAAADFIERVQNNIESAGLNVSGKISDLSIVNTGDSLQITAYPWLIYIDQGVSGTVTKYNTPFSYTDKMPPPDVFKRWIEARQINTANNEAYSGRPQDFQGTSADSAAFAMAVNHKKHGQRPRNVYSHEINQLVTDVAEHLAGFSIANILTNINFD
jgi:hypothetical protein